MTLQLQSFSSLCPPSFLSVLEVICRAAGVEFQFHCESCISWGGSSAQDGAGGVGGVGLCRPWLSSHWCHCQGWSSLKVCSRAWKYKLLCLYSTQEVVEILEHYYKGFNAGLFNFFSFMSCFLTVEGTGSGWNGVDLFCSSLCGAGLWICGWNCG